MPGSLMANLAFLAEIHNFHQNSRFYYIHGHHKIYSIRYICTLFIISVLFLIFYSFMICRNRIFEFFELSDRFLFLKKTFMALYGVIALTVSLTFSLLCLYFLNDWLLVTIACIFIFGILWSLKQIAPELLSLSVSRRQTKQAMAQKCYGPST